MFRIKPAKETFAFLAEKIESYGITRVADLSYLDGSTDLYVYSAMRPGAKSLTTSLGKSIHKDAAKCSAIMESIEAHYAENLQPELSGRTRQSLQSDDDMSWSFLTNDPGSDYDYQDWCIGQSWLGNRPTLIPHALLSLDSTQLDSYFLPQNSDGLASGNDFSEAFIYSFLEQYERMTVQSQRSYPVLVEQKNLDCPVSGGIQIRFYQYDNVLNLPVIECQIKNANPFDNLSIFSGYACHFHLRRAINQAFNEAIQSKIGVIAGLRDDISDTHYSCRQNQHFQHQTGRQIGLLANNFELSLDEQLRFLAKKLAAINKEVVYYVYENDHITVIKSFIVDYEEH